MIASLLYHDVVPPGEQHRSGFAGPVADRYKLTIEAFETHLNAIEASGVDVWCPCHANAAPPNRACVLTFDDGGESFSTEIAPLLEARGWRGCFFVTTNRVNQPGFLTTEQIADLHRRGHVIGSHSHTHPVQISKLSHAELCEEWRQSCELLSQWTGSPIWSASIPGGFYSDEVARAAAECGIQLLFTSEPTVTWETFQAMQLAGRLQVVDQTSAATIGRLAKGDRSLIWQRSLVWNSKKLLKRVAGGTYRQVSAWVFGNRGNSSVARD